MLWLLCNGGTDDVIVGELVLRPLSLHNRRLLDAASDRHSSSLDVSELIEKILNEKKSQNRGAGTFRSLRAAVRAQMGSTCHVDSAA